MGSNPTPSAIFRKDGKVQHETLGNLSHLPGDLIRQRLRGELPPGGPWKIVRSLPHGHIALILGTLKALGPENHITSRHCRQRDLVLVPTDRLRLVV